MKTREDVLSMINWEYTYTVEEIDAILKGTDHQKKKSFYIKLLKSFRWYDLKDVLTETELEEMLSPEVINNLHVTSLKEKYAYVRQVLYGKALPTTR
ncbi:MAG: hypothetical protein KF763_07460 [Cyclobacteriaceae bacterium]|nr:hypothetical protein [Cyclobacteriaceae bacterium]